jgi:hypothetical protein
LAPNNQSSFQFPFLWNLLFVLVLGLPAFGSRINEVVCPFVSHRPLGPNTEDSMRKKRKLTDEHSRNLETKNVELRIWELRSYWSLINGFYGDLAKFSEILHHSWFQTGFWGKVRRHIIFFLSISPGGGLPLGGQRFDVVCCPEPKGSDGKRLTKNIS